MRPLCFQKQAGLETCESKGDSPRDQLSPGSSCEVLRQARVETAEKSAAGGSQLAGSPHGGSAGWQ